MLVEDLHTEATALLIWGGGDSKMFDKLESEATSCRFVVWVEQRGCHLSLFGSGRRTASSHTVLDQRLCVCLRFIP